MSFSFASYFYRLCYNVTFLNNNNVFTTKILVVVFITFQLYTVYPYLSLDDFLCLVLLLNFVLLYELSILFLGLFFIARALFIEL